VDCGLKSSNFKGLAEQNGNAGKVLGEAWNGDGGTQAGPTRVRVNGVEGCSENTAAPYDCVVILPIATDNPAPIKQSAGKFTVVQYGAFRISSCGSNCHAGTLLEDFIIAPPTGTGQWTGSNGWTRDSTSIVSVRLTALGQCLWGPMPSCVVDQTATRRRRLLAQHRDP